VLHQAVRAVSKNRPKYPMLDIPFFVKTQHFSKKTGRLENILQFQMQFSELGKPRAGWIFFK
jgi:hypothetical protein